jgi:predicted RNA-binding Zn-ribbon protein involved in translation (DUF1610 family)
MAEVFRPTYTVTDPKTGKLKKKKSRTWHIRKWSRVSTITAEQGLPDREHSSHDPGSEVNGTAERGDAVESRCPECDTPIPEPHRCHPEGNEYLCPSCGESHTRKPHDPGFYVFFPGDIEESLVDGEPLFPEESEDPMPAMNKSESPKLDGPVRLSHLTHLILELNAALDRGRYAEVSLAEVAQHIHDMDLFPWLRERFAGTMDLGLLCEDTAQQINERLKDILLVHGSRVRRKWGIQNNGLCLLLAWVNELVQRKEGEDQRPPRHRFPAPPASRN